MKKQWKNYIKRDPVGFISLILILVFILLAVFYTASALFLFWGYEFMGAGMATTLHFTYPVFVTLLMLVIFGEKASWVTWLAIALAIFGVAKLSLKEDGLAFDPLGMVIVLLSATSSSPVSIWVTRSVICVSRPLPRLVRPLMAGGLIIR